MTVVKDSNGTITARKGFCSDFMNAFAEHYDIRFESCTKLLFTMIVFKQISFDIL